MTYTAEDWPIAAAMLQFPPLTEASGQEWLEAFTEIKDAGFDFVDLTDAAIRPGDLSAERLVELAQAIHEAGLRAPAVSAIRRSVIDAEHGDDNLAYSHRTLEAAAALGIPLVSFGLHQALSEEQKQQLWFWTVVGHQDDRDDAEAWNRAVARFRELGRHAAELGLLVSLEMYEDTFLGTSASSVRLVSEIGMDNVGLNPDLGNLLRLHRPIEPWRELCEATLPWANYWHVKNYARDEDEARDFYTAVPTPLETGVMSYREAVKIALAGGFQGAICCEHYGGDGLSVSATNRDYLRRHALPKRPGYALGTSHVTQPEPMEAL
ncbi:sugar phosphate isomerase/epimerase [Friedmanniella endophytica]|uniref:Sugar phosphate isomerase/epimerase n=1 Tax=Microlunatus kandeliicorticis TaxID=1759536 RepID=A0A7W3IVJ1_9ACTN|nr:sugar phosphate isomerase/epimerase family protein [Microlunatus kandeliicorticis]MBA8796037.1 sugar phosphate isomerase/epimerase [Microlunatus kandeliicorticis]